jgi:hypothetical protein
MNVSGKASGCYLRLPAALFSSLAAVLQKKEQGSRKVELIFFCEKNEAETCP